MSRSKDPTTLEFAILSLIALEPRAGYDLLCEFEFTAIGTFSGSPGAIYPALRRLEERGLVRGAVNDTRALRPKKIFRPTERGDEVLRSWLRREITRDDVRRRLDELLLRFAFHCLLPANASREFLDELARQIEAYVLELTEQRKLLSDNTPLQGVMAFELGLERYRACARWAHRMRRQFEEAEE